MENVTISGIVQKGMSRGKKLGFPTMNIPLTQQVIEGIYLSYIAIANKQYNALTFIGAAKTFNETTINAETYVLDFDQDVYGQNVTITLIKKLRENKKFDSEKELVDQMERDKKEASEFFKNI